MKQFLRYQISGTVYFLWIIIFYYGGNADDLVEISRLIQKKVQNLKALVGIIAALPIGVLIHQFSVLLKNIMFSKKGSVLSDYPIKDRIKKLNIDDKVIEYSLERISNLNSFYYVRFDNGLLSPLLAWITVSIFMGRSINCIWLISASAIGLVTIIYIKRIYSEIKAYNEIIESNN